MSRFTHFFRKFFVTEKQTPQTFSLLERMAALLVCLIIIATWFEMWRVKNRVVSDNADHAMDDLARNFGRKMEGKDKT